jgi:hypothetical protein
VSAHEVAIVGQILVHLKDPYNALREAAACCSDTLIIAEGSFDADLPYAYFVGGGAATSYWHISNAMYRDWLEKFGFTLIYQNRSSYTCRHPNRSPEHQVWTFVARRNEFVKEPPVLLRMRPTFLQRLRAIIRRHFFRLLSRDASREFGLRLLFSCEILPCAGWGDNQNV